MKIDTIVTIVIAVVKYDMYSADNKATEVLPFCGPRAYEAACKFIQERVEHFCRELRIPLNLHDYGDNGRITVHRSIYDAISKQTDTEDVLLAESELEDRLFARIEYHTL